MLAHYKAQAITELYKVRMFIVCVWPFTGCYHSPTRSQESLAWEHLYYPIMYLDLGASRQLSLGVEWDVLCGHLSAPGAWLPGHSWQPCEDLFAFKDRCDYGPF